MAEKNKAFLGTGMKFPPEVNKATGRFVTSSGEQSVKESIYLILTTTLTERPMRPNFGTTLMTYTFMDMSLTNQTLIMRTVKEQIMINEPRVEDITITADTESRDGVVLFNISYYVSETHRPDSLVFPFYLNSVAEEETYEPENYQSEPVEEITY